MVFQQFAVWIMWKLPLNGFEFQTFDTGNDQFVNFATNNQCDQ